MIRSEISRAVTELRDAFGRVKTEEDVRLLCDVACAIGRDLDYQPLISSRDLKTPLKTLEESLRVSIARLDKLRAR